MKENLVTKVGFYTIYEKITNKQKTYIADSGKTLTIGRFKKTIINPYRDLKTFDNVDDAIKYARSKISKSIGKKEKKISKLPKSLYLVLIKEEKSNKTFVKVGITSKKFIMRRFSKAYGYDGYVLETILRRIDTPDAEKLEEKIKDALNKKRSIKKYRPLLESFSGYSECYENNNINEIIEIFDSIAINA
jgi:hypothetical protein